MSNKIRLRRFEARSRKAREDFYAGGKVTRRLYVESARVEQSDCEIGPDIASAYLAAPYATPLIHHGTMEAGLL